MRRVPGAILISILLLAAASAARAALFSKIYVFKPETTLDIGVEVESGLRLDTVRFSLPSTLGGRVVRTGGLAQADVAVSNIGSESRRVGIALAVFDDDNRLLGVASGGVKLFPLKPGRQTTYGLVFENVNAEIYKATKFQISVEPKP